MPADKKTLTQIAESTESIATQTFKDVNDIGEILDSSKETIESISTRMNKLIRQRVEFEAEMKRTIANEVGKQIKPLNDNLNKLLTLNPKVVYIYPRFPNILNLFLKFKYLLPRRINKK